MAKRKIKKVVQQCQCSRCGQVASVEPYQTHFHCRGFQIVKPLPAMFHELTNPSKRGCWIPISASVEAGA